MEEKNILIARYLGWEICDCGSVVPPSPPH